MSTQPYPIRFSAEDDFRRSRLTVFFRPLLCIPHFVVLYLWSLVVLVAVFITWFAALVMGRAPTGLHNFIAAYLRYSTRVSAYILILANPYPPFGSGGSYPVDIEIDPPATQGRVGIFFRVILTWPCLLMVGAMNSVLFAVAVGSWWVALFTGRVPSGLAGIGQYCTRFTARTHGYLFLLTSRYPVLGDPVTSDPFASRAGEGSLSASATALPPIP